METTVGKVVADGEEVIFEEGVPSSTRHIFDLISQVLGEQRRAIVSFEVDGEDCLKSGEFPEGFDSINAQSMLHDEIILRICSQLIDHTSQLPKQLEAYQANVLTTPWSDVFKRMDEFINRIQPFADLIDNVAHYVQSYSPPWSDSFQSIASSQAESLNLLLQSFERRDPAGLSACLASEITPLTIKAQNLFSSEVIPYLQACVNDSGKKEK